MLNLETDQTFRELRETLVSMRQKGIFRDFFPKLCKRRILWFGEFLGSDVILISENLGLKTLEICEWRRDALTVLSK